jgi:hypothetical protein
MTFADVVLVRLIFGGVALILLAAALALIALGLKITGNATSGWFTTVVGLSVITVMQPVGIFAGLLVFAGMERGRIFWDASKAYLDCLASVDATQ